MDTLRSKAFRIAQKSALIYYYRECLGLNCPQTDGRSITPTLVFSIKGCHWAIDIFEESII
jgi:hypothetical protein